MSAEFSAESYQLLSIAATAAAVLIGCVFLFFWRRSNGQKSSRAAEAPKPLIDKKSEPEADDGKKKVTVFFGTQTGTAEGFAKVRV